jgi:hypothetical protein
MSIAEMKIDIQKKMDGLNEEQLNQVDRFIELINKRKVDENDFVHLANKIIEANHTLLQRLAQ